MNDTIGLVESKTFWAALFAFLAVVFNAFHLSQYASWVGDPANIDTVVNGVAMASTVAAVVFRGVATSKVASILPAAKTP